MMEERKMILKMLEEGKINSEEAIRLLETLEVKSDVQSEKKESAGPNINFNKSESSKGHDEAVATVYGKKVGDMVERIIQKVNENVKKIDFDFDNFDWSFGGGVKVDLVYEGRVTSQPEFDFNTYNGAIDVEGWDQDGYRIEVKGQVKAATEQEAKTLLQDVITHEQKEDKIVFHVERKKGVRAALKVYVPNRGIVDFKSHTSNGAITLDDLNLKKLRATTSNGAVRADDIYADVIDVETSNGKVDFNDIETNHLSISTSNGAIHFEGVAKDAECVTSNGQIRYTLEKMQEGDVKLRTSNGSIHVELERGDIAIIGEAHTTFGSIDCSLSNTMIQHEGKENSRRHIRFEKNRDAAQKLKLNCKTSNGSIHIHE